MYFTNFLLQAAPAPAAGGNAGGGGMMMILMMVAIFAIMYFFMIRPQQKKQKEIQKFQNALTEGTSVVTGGGIYGTVKSVRLYDRMLSEDELAWNRKVDEARFFGRLTTTNVVLEATEWNGALAAGPYEVFGTYTFEASPSPEDGHLPTHVRVWTLRTDGTWASAGSVEGASYAYTPAAGTVKIEFRTSHPFVLIVR